jgi:hypothetical protein
MSTREAVKPIEDAVEPEESGPGRSTIKFPYLDLEDAMAVAKGVHDVGGNSCQRDALAAHFDVASNGGGFNLRLITAKMFGLIGYDKGQVSLTTLGQRILDPQKAKAARAESFLAVPLYKALYDEYKGNLLPANQGLENTIERLGVAPKQKDKARQVFQRSATQSGFFAYGNNRLVMPTIKGSVEVETPKEEDKGKGAKDDDGSGEERKLLHPFIQGLLDKLPKAESEWSIEARKKWLQTAANIFDLMYSSADNDGELSIKVNKGSAN